MVMFIDDLGELMMVGARSRAASSAKTEAVTDPLLLKSTLIQYGKNQKILDHVSSVLAPLYKIADSGQFPFSPAEMLKEDTLCRSIGNLLSRDVSGVRIVSISRTIPLGLFSSDYRYQERLAGALDIGSLMYTRSELLHMRLFGTFGYGFIREFQRVIYASLWKGLGIALTVGTRPIAEQTGQTLFWPALERCLFFYLCHSLFGSPKDTEEMQRLEFLLKSTASGVLLLGERADQPGVWMVIAG